MGSSWDRSVRCTGITIGRASPASHLVFDAGDRREDLLDPLECLDVADAGGTGGQSEHEHRLVVVQMLEVAQGQDFTVDSE